MQPFIKWAGGKTQLLSRITERLPESYNDYYEPFIGSGALLFELAPQNAVINDINKELIHVYKTIRDYPDEITHKLRTFDDIHDSVSDHKSFYLRERERFNRRIIEQVYDIELAALFIYINKHCFNGLYRVNSKGLFNVPFNGKKRGNSFKEANLREISSYLKSVTILNGDFETAVKDAKKGDFVFFDSPYAPLNETSFESYTKDGFGVINHERLASLFKSLTNKGVYCMLTNHNTDLINKLYAEFNLEVVAVKRMINSDSSNRVGEETIITNYPTKIKNDEQLKISI